MSKNYTFYVYLYPLSHHKEATRMSYYVLHQKSVKEKVAALIAIGNGEKTYIMFNPDAKEKAKFDKSFANTAKLANSLGVRGTPSVYDFNGAFVNWSKLK